jgi:demethylmenaquinone methyltransferase/2-methoxy-6-polyprenyl-1,4-benzoquinol methylase
VDDTTREILDHKGTHVKSMFDRIAGWYDFLNHFLSLGIDRRWRKKLIRTLAPRQGDHILDVATGTGDLAFTILRRCDCRVTGMDVSEEMMAVGRKKTKKKGLEKDLRFVSGKAEEIPFEEKTFDAVTVAFGVRNFTDLEQGLKEMHRVLRPGGTVAILEFSKPARQPLKALYSLYLFHLLPWAGRLFSGDRYAYTYLPESIRQFPQREDFLKIMAQCGYEDRFYQTYTGGIVAAYFGKKK